MTHTQRNAFILLSAVCLLIATAFVAYKLKSQTAEHIAAYKEARTKSERLNKTISDLINRLEASQAENTVLGLWSVESENQAITEFQSRLADLSKKNGVNLRAISPIRTRGFSELQAVAFRIEAEVPLSHLVDLLVDIEFQPPLAVVTRANLRRVASRETSQSQPSVFFQLDVLAPFVLAQSEVE